MSTHLKGETLATRLEIGPIPLAQALACFDEVRRSGQRARTAFVLGRGCTDHSAVGQTRGMTSRLFRR
jgi:hypothetical protein